MKSIIQIVALLVVVVGGVFGVTFLTQYIRKPVVTVGTGTDKPLPAKLLEWPVRKAPWGEVLGIPGYESLEIEKGSKGHYDFVVQNATNQAVKLVREPQANCTCTNLRVFFGVLPDAQGAKLTPMEPPNLPVGPQLEPYLAGVQWKPLDADATIGPSAPQTLPGSEPALRRYGVVRIDWEAVLEKKTNILVNIVARQGPAADYLLFDVPISVRPPVLASTELLTLGEINPGEKKEESLVIWSPTRDQIDATAKLVTADPCIVVTPPRLLMPEELKALPAALLQRGVQSLCRTKCAYEIKVAAYERLGDNQLELGPFARRIVINSGTVSEVSVTVAGTVRGPIEVGEVKDRDRVDFGVFRSDIGADKSVAIKSSIPGLQLSIDRVTPATIKAELNSSTSAFGGRTWKLTVVVPPDSQAGQMPADSAIYLKTNSTPPRRVRIPLVGNASG